MPSRTTTIEDLATLRTAIREDLHGELQPIQQSLAELNTKVTALLESAAVREQLRRLVHQLQQHGIQIDEHHVFADARR